MTLGVKNDGCMRTDRRQSKVLKAEHAICLWKLTARRFDENLLILRLRKFKDSKKYPGKPDCKDNGLYDRHTKDWEVVPKSYRQCPASD